MAIKHLLDTCWACILSMERLQASKSVLEAAIALQVARRRWRAPRSPETAARQPRQVQQAPAQVGVCLWLSSSLLALKYSLTCTSSCNRRSFGRCCRHSAGGRNQRCAHHGRSHWQVGTGQCAGGAAIAAGCACSSSSWQYGRRAGGPRLRSWVVFLHPGSTVSTTHQLLQCYRCLQGGIGPAGLASEDLHVLDFTDFDKPRWHR